jgi:Multicopper oxidase
MIPNVNRCNVLNLWCESVVPKPPTARPVKPPPTPTRVPTQKPTPSTRTCTSCLTQQTWNCPYAETCGCNVDNCLPPGTPTPNCSCRTMVPVPWNSNHQATIELCQDLTNSSIYGYRLPGEDSCHLAALMIRVVPGNQYRLTIRNRAAWTTTNLHTHGIHISGNGNADNPMRVVAPGNCITYHWDIPANHMGGTHWMHSHDMENGYDQVREPADVPCAVANSAQTRWVERICR